MPGTGLGHRMVENAVTEHPPLARQPTEPTGQGAVEAVAAQLVDSDQHHECRRRSPDDGSQKARDEEEEEKAKQHERGA